MTATLRFDAWVQEIYSKLLKVIDGKEVSDTISRATCIEKPRTNGEKWKLQVYLQSYFYANEFNKLKEQVFRANLFDGWINVEVLRNLVNKFIKSKACFSPHVAHSCSLENCSSKNKRKI